MKKFSSKIISGLAASLIGLSPIMGTQVSAVWIESAHQDKDIGACTREELLEALPDIWQRLWTEWDAAIDAGRSPSGNPLRLAELDAAVGAAWQTARCVAMNAKSYAKEKAAGETAQRNTFQAAWKAAFSAAWRKDGVAYSIVKDKSREYFQNLVTTVLEND